MKMSQELKRGDRVEYVGVGHPIAVGPGVYRDLLPGHMGTVIELELPDSWPVVIWDSVGTIVNRPEQVRPA